MKLASRIPHWQRLAFLLGVFLSGVALVPAATIWIGAPNGTMNSGSNWDNGLPAAGNPGTIPSGAGAINFNLNIDGFSITQEGGTASNAFSDRTISNGGIYAIEGGSISLTKGIILGSGGGTFDVSGASTAVTLGEDLTTSGTGGIYTQSGGTVQAASLLYGNSGSGTFTLSGGTFTTTGDSTFRQAGSLNLTGGSFTADSTSFITLFGSGDQPFDATISGGSHDFGDFTLATSFNVLSAIDISLSGNGTVSAASFTDNTNTGPWAIDADGTWTGSLTIAGFTQADYENWYSNDNLRFEGSSVAPFADVFAVSGATLTLVPEPGTVALLGLGAAGLLLWHLRRRTQRRS